MTPEKPLTLGSAHSSMFGYGGGGSTAAAAERERFARILSPLAGSPALEN